MVVPEISGGRSDEPLDLGTIELKPVKPGAERRKLGRGRAYSSSSNRRRSSTCRIVESEAIPRRFASRSTETDRRSSHLAKLGRVNPPSGGWIGT